MESLEDKCIHQLFEAQACKTPNNIAIDFEGQRLNYQQLNQQANQLAHYLIEQSHVTPDTLVGICIERSLEMVVAILAILKAGGAYVPIDPASPPARLAYVIKDAKLTTVLTSNDTQEQVSMCMAQSVSLMDTDLQKTLWTYSTGNLHLPALMPHHLAYVIYTSGSTGQPKGVMIEHRSLSSHIIATSQALNIVEHDHFLQMVSFSFDTFVEQFFASLTKGSCTFFVKNILMSLDDFFAFTQKNDITITDLSPAYLESFLTASSKEKWLSSSLTRLVVGGESFPLSLLNNWFAFGNHAKCQFFNAYGPTEAVITTTLRELTPADQQQLSIGKAIGNRTTFVLDEQQQLCGVGCVGELYIGGNIARGYLNKKEQTLASFFELEINGDSPARYYRTGDFVKQLSDGRLLFMGREDDQIKIRGFRIELAEIEVELVTIAEISSSLLVVNKDKLGNKILVLYVIPTESPDVVNSIKAQLQLRLPPYMVPSLFVIIERWPLTINGKIDRKALPQPQAGLTDVEYIPPETFVEKSLAQTWSRLLTTELSHISVKSNFFDLGGHSLLVVKLLNEISVTLQSTLSVKDVFEHPSLFEISNKIEAMSALEKLNNNKKNKVIITKGLL
jgi:amino acid adenylation domain-containing protein